jgi:hypothetical protein
MFRSLLSLVLLLSCCVVATCLEAGELRIETDVYTDDNQEPLSHTVTLLDAGTAYDFAEDRQEIAVFRLPTSSHPGQFILLDLATQQRTEVSTDQINGLMDKLVQWAQAQEDPMLQFSAAPVFEETFAAGSGQLTLNHALWNYTVATVPAENTKTLHQYRQFMDWYTRLNVMMHGTPPPGPRLALNAALEKHAVVPVEIRRTVEGQSASLRSTHLFSWRLSREDRSKLDEVRAHLANFKKVANKDFLAKRMQATVVRGQSK